MPFAFCEEVRVGSYIPPDRRVTSHLARLPEEIVQDYYRQVPDAAKVNVVGDKKGAASVQSRRGVESVGCSQTRLRT